MTSNPSRYLFMSAIIVLLSFCYAPESAIAATSSVSVTPSATSALLAISLTPGGGTLVSGTLCTSTTPSDVGYGSTPTCGAGATSTPLTISGTSNALNTTVARTSLTPGTQYYYSIETTDVDATTVWYDTGTFTTLSEATAKGAYVGTVDVGASDPNAVVTIGPPTALAATDLPTSTVSLTGLVPYGVTNVASGATLTITVVVSGTLAPTTVLRKSGGVFSDITSQATISGQVVTFSVTDGGAGDGDGLTNGALTDSVAILGAKQNQATLTVANTKTAWTMKTKTIGLAFAGGSGVGRRTFQVDTLLANTANCSIIKRTLRFTSPGTCYVTVTKAATALYVSATSAPLAFTFSLATQLPITVSNTNVTNTVGKSIKLYSRGGSGKGALTFSVVSAGNSANCTISGRHLSARASGTCSVEVVKAATAIYSSVTSDPLLFTFHF